jgi:hypothetical protein
MPRHGTQILQRDAKETLHDRGVQTRRRQQISEKIPRRTQQQSTLAMLCLHNLPNQPLKHTVGP